MNEVSCEQVHQWLTFLIDDVSLETEQQNQLENHLKTCEKCKSLFSELKLIDDTIKFAMEAAVKGHISSEKLGDYLDGAIQSDVEKKIIELHLQQCDSCREAYEKMAAVNAFEREFELKSRKFLIKKSLKDFQDKILRLPELIFIKPRVIVPLAAAVILIAVVISVFRVIQKPVSLSELAHIEPFPYIEAQMRGGDTSLDQLEKEGMEFYQSGDYEKAIDRLSHVVEKDSTRLVERFYLGICFFMEKNLDEAEIQFIEARKSPLLVEKSNWYLAQVYLLKNEKKKALKALDTVISLHQALYFEKARKLKERILQMENNSRHQ